MFEWSSKVVYVSSAKSPGLTGLGVDNKYSEVIIPSGTTLILSRVVISAAGCANGEQQEKRQQKANG